MNDKDMLPSGFNESFNSIPSISDSRVSMTVSDSQFRRGKE